MLGGRSAGCAPRKSQPCQSLPARCCHTQGLFQPSVNQNWVCKIQTCLARFYFCLHFFPRSEQDWPHSIQTRASVMKAALIHEPWSLQSLDAPTLPKTRVWHRVKAGSCCVRHLSGSQLCTVKIWAACKSMSGQSRLGEQRGCLQTGVAVQQQISLFCSLWAACQPGESRVSFACLSQGFSGFLP